MQAKQVFSTYNDKEDGDDWGQFKHCPFCGTQLVLKEKGGQTQASMSQLPVCAVQEPLSRGRGSD
jgi:hypothetical protein